MKKLLIFILLITNSVFGANKKRGEFQDLFKAPEIDNSRAAKLGPFAVGYKFCTQFQRVAGILQVYANVAWPVVGSGFATGIVQNESVLYKTCDYLIQLTMMDTEGGIYHTARFLNDLTEKKWDHQLAQADLTWNTANSIYDFRGDGGFRKGALTSASTHRTLLNYANQSKKWFNSGEFDGKGEAIEDKNRRQQRINEASRIAYKRAILTEAAKCPEAKNKDYSKEYTKKVVPLEQKKEDAKYEIENIRRQMFEMGKDFIVDLNELEKYHNAIDTLINSGYNYTATEKITTVERTVPSKTKLDKENYPVEQKEKKKVEYQKVSANRDSNLWNDFRNFYVKKWESWVTGQMYTTGTFGLLTGKKGRVESKYRDFSFECSEKKIKGNLQIKDRNDERYYDELAKKRAECKNNLKVRESEFKNLMDQYITQLDVEVKNYKNSIAEIWSFESYYMGTRPISKNVAGSNGNKELEKDLKNIQRPEEDCRPQLTPGEMMLVQQEMKTVELETNEHIMKTAMQSQLMEEEKAKSEYNEKEEFKKSNEQFLEKMKNKDNVNISMPMTSPKSGI